MSLPPEVQQAHEKFWSIIPVGIDKKPLFAWKQFQQRTPTTEELSSWAQTPPPAWAVITGAISALVILDFDGEKGKATLAALNLIPHVLTGSGGYHVYFRHPGWPVQTLNGKAKAALGEKYPGLDIRADGGYAVFTGKNRSGEYRWLRPMAPDALSTVPVEVAEFLGLLSPVSPSSPASAGGRDPSLVAASDLISRALTKASTEGRNNAGMWLACQLRDRDYTESEARTMMETYATSVPGVNSKGQPEPYTRPEALATLRQAYRSMKREPPRNPNIPVGPPLELTPPSDEDIPPAPAPEQREFPRTDQGNAERLRRRVGRYVRYCYAWEKWLIWDQRRWKIDEDGQIFRFGVDTVRGIHSEAAKVDDSSVRKEVTKWAFESENRSRLQNMVSLAQKEPGIAITPTTLDSDPMLLNCANGTINLRTGHLRVHRRDDHMTKLAPVDYDPAATAPVWDMFIRQIMLDRPALIEYLQRVVGYSLTGDVREKAVFILYGSGDNGKTTFLEAVRNVLGDYAGTIPVESLMQTRQATGREASPDLAELKGKRFVTTSEADDGQRMNEARVKHLTGMGRITARPLYSNPFEFDPMHKLFLDSNYKPTVRGQDKGIWTRLKLIPFDLRLTPEKMDRTLGERLKAEAPGILAWAVRGCMEWLRAGLAEPEEVTIAVSGYRNQMDVLGRFLEDCTRTEEGYSTPASELYKVYVAWAKEGGEYAWSDRVFGERLIERGFERTRKSAGKFYLNLVLSQEVSDSGKLKKCIDAQSCIENGEVSHTRPAMEKLSGARVHNYTSIHGSDDPTGSPGEPLEEVF